MGKMGKSFKQKMWKPGKAGGGVLKVTERNSMAVVETSTKVVNRVFSSVKGSILQ